MWSNPLETLVKPMAVKTFLWNFDQNSKISLNTQKSALIKVVENLREHNFYNWRTPNFRVQDAQKLGQHLRS